MKTPSFAELKENLKELKLSTMAREVESHERQARESGVGYDDFLLDLTIAELQMRTEKRLTRRIREAKFPLLKTLEGFDYDAASGLDLRLIRELSGCDYTREGRNVLFRGPQRHRQDPSWRPAWVSRPARTTSGPVSSAATAW